MKENNRTHNDAQRINAWQKILNGVFMHKKIYTVLVAAAVFVTVVVFETCKTGNTGPAPVDGLVTGYVYTEVVVKGQQSMKKVFLPDVVVTIKDGGGVTVAVDTTDLDGGYRTKQLKKGKYKLLLTKTGFDPATYDVEVKFATNHPGKLKIGFKGRDYIYGTVKLADGFAAIYRNLVFGVNFFTTVTPDYDPTLAVRCNVVGEFILKNIDPSKKFGITATCQKAVTAQEVQADGSRYDLVFKNTRPFIQSIVAVDGSGKHVLRTIPNAKLNMTANVLDKESNVLTYMWKPYGNYPGSNFTNSNQAVWQMTGIRAKNIVTLLVIDSFGGFAYTNYRIEDYDNKVAFSGVVQNIDGSGNIPDAVVTVNGRQVAKTNANGYFSARVDEVKNNRYVLNVEKAGYMLSSTIYLKDAHDKVYKLVRATIKDFDPKDSIVLVEQEDKYTRFSVDDRKNQQKRTRKAASIKIPAGAIVDSAGNPVSSMVTVQLRTIDLYDPEGLMPGDYAAVQGGSDKTLISYGAIDVQIRDKANPEKRYKLNGSALADVNIPISSILQSAAPANIALWDYNEVTGIWEDMGTIAKVADKYVGKTKRFSSVNTDVAITGGTCIYLQDNPNNPIFPGEECDVTITVPTSGAPKIKHATISEGDQTLVIARLPLDTDISIEVKRDGNTIAARTIHTALVSSAPASAIDPANPETVCTVDFYKKDPPLADVAASFAPFLARVETPSEEQAIAYYVSTGAITDVDNDGIFELSEGETFTAWKTRNGFDGGDDEHASYQNLGDLGFHRAMHQKTTGTHVAFYVSNFDNFTDCDSNVFFSAGPVPAATVAMEYDKDASTGTRGIIKFYLFKGPSETLETFVDLDGNGDKFIPGLCIECHGGVETDYTALAAGTGLRDYYAANPAQSPCFIGFDLQQFDFSGDHPIGTQQNNLRNLNQRVYDANAPQGIQQFLTAAYGNSTPLAGDFVNDATASGWLAGTTNGINNAFFYQKVEGPSCRTCHASKEHSLPLQFNAPGDFAGADFAVCGSGKYMPNAKVTFIRFWESQNPYQPEQLRLFCGVPSPCE